MQSREETNIARMHARKKGKSGSKKPLATTPPSWINYKPEEIKTLVVKLAKQELSTSEIGLTLRDVYGIPDVRMSTKQKITQILKEKNLSSKLPEDLQNLIRKVVKLQKHLTINKKDKFSKRGLQLTEAKIRRLIKYYKRNAKLPKDWKYDPARAELLVR